MRAPACLFAVACASGCFTPASPQALPDEASSSTASVADDSSGPAASSSGDGTSEPSPGTSGGSTPETSPGSESGGSSSTGDVVTECTGMAAGFHCVEGNAIECDEDGIVVDTADCSATACVEAIGCVACLEGQFDCQGTAVFSCDADASPPSWVQSEVCDAAVGEGCVVASGTCEILEAIGTTEPTGVMYQFANFSVDDGIFLGGYDVDAHEDRLYVNGVSGTIDVYEVELLDSDGDGTLEPDQHPDDPAHTGPIEERRLTFVESIVYPAPISLSVEELYVLDDRVFKGGVQLTEYVLAGGALSTLTTLPAWASSVSQIAFDDAHGIWYGSNEQFFRVFQFDAATDTWGLAFVFPPFANHTDGLEVVTQAETGVPYLYVSGMLSTMLMQYRKDPVEGWVQENVFASDAVEQPLEGMGFGTLDHFWGTSGNTVFELGGGDMAEYIVGTPTP